MMRLFKKIGTTALVCMTIIAFSTCGSLDKKNSNNAKVSEANKKSDTITIKNDSLNYEIQIYEPGFWSWLQQQKPRGYHNQKYLENRNWRYVTQYNIRASKFNQFDPNLYPQEIDYQTRIDYGYEVNYLLYHFFRFFEQKYDQNLLR